MSNQNGLDDLSIDTSQKNEQDSDHESKVGLYKKIKKMENKFKEIIENQNS